MYFKDDNTASSVTFFETDGAKVIQTGAIALNIAAGISFAAAALTF